MSLTVIKRARVMRRYLAYDLEWIPAVPSRGIKHPSVRMVGVYDGERYRCYRSVEAFLEYELTSKNRGKWFYAHAGGLADFQFVLEKILAGKGYSISASFSGSSVIIAHVKRGKNSWHFVDSYWLLKDKLANIGKAIGMEKGEEQDFESMSEDDKREFYTNAPFEELRRYNERDCQILYRGIEEFEGELIELGGMLKMTQASCAMELFRRRFLKQDIDTSAAVNEIARKAYFASRVEVITRHCDSGEYYDVNSSFPYAMTFACPGDFMGSSRRLPDAGLYIADVDVEVPETYLPPLPVRAAGRLFFPTGKWRAWLSNVDLELLEQTGGRILKVYESLAFEPFYDLRDYAQTLFELRKKATGFRKVAFKYLLNSLYGKFAESAWKNGLVFNPATRPEKNASMLFPGVWIVEKEVPIPHMHVPISVHITAIARRTLYDYMSNSSELHYCDTDGFSTTNRFRESKELGGIKLEKIIEQDTIFHAAKVYWLKGKHQNKEGDWVDLGDDGVKAKGFSRMTIERMEQLLDDQAIEYTRMVRVKELLRSGHTMPEERVIRKRLRKDAMPKRCFYPDGHSRPWHIDEIRNTLGKELAA